MDQEEKEKFKGLHKGGIRGLFQIYTWGDILTSGAFWFSFCFSVGLIIAIVSSDNFYAKDYLLDLSKYLVNTFVCLIGFNLGGFAIVVGISNPRVISALTSSINKRGHSLYQRTISVFAFSIMLQTLALLISFCVSYSAKISFKSYNFAHPLEYFNAVNCIAIFVLAFLSSWAIFVVINLALNLFSFGQLNHMLIRIDQMTPTEKSKIEQKLEEIVKKQDAANNQFRKIILSMKKLDKIQEKQEETKKTINENNEQTSKNLNFLGRIFSRRGRGK